MNSFRYIHVMAKFKWFCCTKRMYTPCCLVRLHTNTRH